MKITESQDKAAGEIIELIANELGENRAVHPGTAISSCARLAGSFLFRSFNHPTKDLTPGTVVLSNEANEKGPVLINILSWMLNQMGITIDEKKFNEVSKAESDKEFLETLNLLQNKAVKIMKENNLDFEQMAYSCAMATAFIIKECQADIVPESGFNTAIYGFIEGTKTYPPELSVPGKKSIFSFWKK